MLGQTNIRTRREKIFSIVSRLTPFLNERLSQNIITFSLNHSKDKHGKGKITHSFQKYLLTFMMIVHGIYDLAMVTEIKSKCWCCQGTQCAYRQGRHCSSVSLIDSKCLYLQLSAYPSKTHQLSKPEYKFGQSESE